MNKNLSENFIDLTFIRNLGDFTKKKASKNGLRRHFLPFDWPKFWAGKILAQKFCPPKKKFSLLN